MAYLRRGLVTNRGAVPSIHTKNQAFVPVADMEQENHAEHDHQPVIVLRQVKRIIKMANIPGEYHIVELECGHTTKSRGTFQTTCRQCARKHEEDKQEMLVR